MLEMLKHRFPYNPLLVDNSNSSLSASYLPALERYTGSKHEVPVVLKFYLLMRCRFLDPTNLGCLDVH
jgi:hypothetical protein